MPQPLHTVRPPERGTRLIDFLAERLKTSKKRVKRLLDDRVVFVNDRRVWMAHHELEAGDRVEVQDTGRGQTPFGKGSDPVPPRVLFQDSDYLVVDKPAGLLSNGPDSLEEFLRASLSMPTLQAVHRLDRDTTGCLLFSRNAKAHDAMIAVFEEREVTKVYHALAIGRVSDRIHEISAPVDGKPALTRVQVLAGNEVASHLRLNLETGRTHQIRKHLAAIRHPLLGDKMYATGALPLPILRTVPRQMLHSSSIAFVHPLNRAEIRVESPLPGDFRHWMKTVKLT